MNIEVMSGRKRIFSSYLQPFERKLIKHWVPLVPKMIETYHLTLLTLVFSGLAVLVGYFARGEKLFLMLNSLLVILQYVTDVLDGAVGRYRKTGLVRWGFYMDHLFDYIFACALAISYSLAYYLPLEFSFIILLVVSGYFVHEFLMASAIGELNVSGYYGFGPTEIRVFAVLIGLVVPFFPFDFILGSVGVLGVIFGTFFIQLIYRAQKKLWKIDMKKKRKK
jgi:phosphatidylglycerophosphate synthase